MFCASGLNGNTWLDYLKGFRVSGERDVYND